MPRPQENHGMRYSGEYDVWKGIIQRCCLKSSRSYPSYGGQGVKMCTRWRKSFSAFFEDMGPRPSPRHSIDRIDNEGDYEPQNCRWATRRQQANNRKNTVYVDTKDGPTPLSIACERAGIARDTAYRRLKAGWSDEEALNIPIGQTPDRLHKKHVLKRSKLTPEQVREIRQSTLSGNELAAKYGVHRKHIYRVRSGRRWKQEVWK